MKINSIHKCDYNYTLQLIREICLTQEKILKNKDENVYAITHEFDFSNISSPRIVTWGLTRNY